MNTLETRTRLYAAVGDRYHLERTVGEGRLATVYLARDLKHGRDVAIKVLKSDIGDAVGADRFRREMDIAAALSHANIVPVIDSGDANGALFYVMPKLAGQTLRHEMTAWGQLRVDDAIRIVAEIAGALDYAHERGVLHRDIKPENVMLEDGRALTVDFGVGNAIGSALADTAFAIPAYMSPEQVAGEPIDSRSDVYSLACVLYEMLVGEPPFAGPPAQVMTSKRFMQTPPSVMAVRDGIPRSVGHALQSALARSAADRPATAAAFVRALMEPESAATPANATLAVN
jgi:eukaryotic-like serine/threonine-protein kinase